MTFRPIFILVLSHIALVVCGCDKSPQMVPVSGSVEARGKAVEMGRIIFEPVDKTGGLMSAIGEIVDGSFSLYTNEDGDGVQPGKYYAVILDPKEDTRKKRDRLGVVTLNLNVLEVTAEGPNEFAIEITAKDLKYALDDD